MGSSLAVSSSSRESLPWVSRNRHQQHSPPHMDSCASPEGLPTRGSEGFGSTESRLVQTKKDSHPHH